VTTLFEEKDGKPQRERNETAKVKEGGKESTEKGGRIMYMVLEFDLVRGGETRKKGDKVAKERVTGNWRQW